MLPTRYLHYIIILQFIKFKVKRAQNKVLTASKIKYALRMRCVYNLNPLSPKEDCSRSYSKPWSPPKYNASHFAAPALACDRSRHVCTVSFEWVIDRVSTNRYRSDIYEVFRPYCTGIFKCSSSFFGVSCQIVFCTEKVSYGSRF